MKSQRTAAIHVMQMKSTMPSVVFWLVVLAMLMGSLLAHGQTNAGTLAGTVLDPDGLPVVKATLAARNNATGETTTTISTGAGTYRFNELKPGRYSVVTSAPGFKKSEASDVEINVSQTTGLTVQLQTGENMETVSVSASAAELQTQSSDIGTSVGPSLVANLPLSVGTGELRSVIDFTFLVPGVVGGENVNKIAGGQATGSSVEVDGGSIDTITGGNFNDATYTPSVDAVQEFTILQSGYPAQYGRTTGGIVNFGTLSGTNEFHGKVYDILHNTALNANSWFNNLQAAANPANASLFKRPVDMKNEYGFTIGGPARIPHIYDGRDRTFFFVSWEQYRQNLGSVITSSLPTAANRNGDFRASLTSTVIGTNPCNGQPIYQGEIFDPATTTQVGGVYCRTPFAYNGNLNTIDPARFSQVAKNVLGYLPSPQTSALLNNYSFPSSHPILITGVTVRIDHSFGAKDKIFGSYNPNYTTKTNQGRAFPGPANPSGSISQYNALQDGHIGYDHTFTSTTFNHVVLSLYRFANHTDSTASLDGINYSQSLGLGNNISGNLFPIFTLGEGYTAPGNQTGTDDFQNHVEISDNFLHSSGKHTWNIGVDFRHTVFSRFFRMNATGAYTFARTETAGTNSLTTLSGNSFASFLLGQVSSATAKVAAVVPQRRQEYIAFYVQDDYKVLPSLILNLGLRYDIDMPHSEHYGNVNNWDPTLLDTNLGIPGGLIFSGTGPGRSGLSSRLANTYYKDLGPRLGFAWAPKFLGDKTAIRGSYGIIYGPTPMNFPINGEPGFAAIPTFSDALQPGAFSAPFTLDQGFPAFTKTVNTDPFQLDNTATTPFYTARSYGRVAMIQNWGLEVQQALPQSMVLSLTYTGNRGTHLSSNLQCPNCLPLAYYSLGSALAKTYSATITTVNGYSAPYSGFHGTLAQRLEPFPQITSITTAQENVGQSSYNALYAKLQRSYSKGLTLLASYTWSKSMTNADGTLVNILAGGFQNPFNPKGEISVSAQDYRNVFALSYVYDLPFGRGKAFLNKSRVLNEIVGNWKVGGVHRLQSGSPANFGCATAMPGNSPCFHFNLNPAVSVYSAAEQSGQFNPLTSKYFNAAGFVDPNSNARIAGGGAYQYGTLTRNVDSIRYPVSPDTDFSVIKGVDIVEGVKGELRVEFFNAFNQHRLGTPNQAPNNPAFGTITGTQNIARVGQVTLRITF